MNIGVATEPPRLRSELETPRQRRRRRAARILVVVVAALVYVPAILIERAAPKGEDGHHAEDADRQVEVLAKRCFPRWRAAHPDQRCPAQLGDLDDSDMLDPWGHALQYTCDPRLLRAASPGIAITSAGEDGTFGTADDIGSDL